MWVRGRLPFCELPEGDCPFMRVNRGEFFVIYTPCPHPTTYGELTQVVYPGSHQPIFDTPMGRSYNTPIGQFTEHRAGAASLWCTENDKSMAVKKQVMFKVIQIRRSDVGM